MKRALKQTITALAGLGVLALVAHPIASAAAEERAGEAAPPQFAHMGDGDGGGYAGGMRMMNRGMMGRGYQMGPGMMGGGSGMGAGMAGQDCPMGATMTEQGQNMGPGMMGPGYRMAPPAGRQGMIGPGMRVVPRQNVTTDDVRQFLKDRLARQGNKRLKIGEIKQADDDSITADIVTADNSLVWRFKIDRHSGRMQAVE